MKKGYSSPLDEPGRAEARNKMRDVLKDIQKEYPKHPAVSGFKYFQEPVAAAPSPTDASDHNGKYFQNVSKAKPTIEKC